MNIDWSKAPEGATHFGVDDPENMWLACWHKKIDGEWYDFLADRPDQWDRTVFDGSRRHRARVMSFIEKPVFSDQEAEQIASEERKQLQLLACADIEADLAQYNTSIDCSAAIRAAVDAMIAAGYRKQEQPK